MEYFYNQNKNHGYYDQPTHATGHVMATSAMILGVAALSTCWTFYLPIILGCLGWIAALLSKGFERKLSGSAKIGLLCAATAIVISFIFTLTSAIYLINNPEVLLDFGRQSDQMIQQVYGQSAEMVTGYSYEDIMRQLIEYFQQ